MLGTEYETQYSSIDMNSPQPSNQHNIPGPFHFFYQLADVKICIDTHNFGNDSRLVRRCCRPNPKKDNLKKNGIHLFIVGLTYIKANTEITLAYDQQPTSTACTCGQTKSCLFRPLHHEPKSTASLVQSDETCKCNLHCFSKE